MFHRYYFIKPSGRKWEKVESFIGKYEYTLDSKGRFCLPSKMRRDDTKVLYAIKGLENCISLYTEEGFNSFIQKLEALEFYKSAKARKTKRSLFSSAEKIEMDGSGRILLPKKLLEKHQISSKVTIVGTNDHIEIWDPNNWDEYINQDIEETFEAIFNNED